VVGYSGHSALEGILFVVLSPQRHAHFTNRSALFAYWLGIFHQLIMTEPVQRLWDFSLSCNSGYEYFMQRPDGRILLGT
jgi:hypothetical protein